MEIKIGSKIGRWKVLSEERFKRRNGKSVKAWKCVCDCGTEKVIIQYNLKSGMSKSCGCIISDNMRAKQKRRNTEDGREKPHFADDRLRRILVAMKNRCSNQKSKNYKKYGAKGIKVCDEWNKSYWNFREWALQNGYKDGLTIDRIDNTLGYGPDNCRWCTYLEQNNNKTNNVFVVINGQKKTLSQWARHAGISRSAMHSRYKRGDRGERLIRASVR